MNEEHRNEHKHTNIQRSSTKINGETRPKDVTEEANQQCGNIPNYLKYRNHVTLDHKSVDLFTVLQKSLTLKRVQQQTLRSNTKAVYAVRRYFNALRPGVRLATHLHLVPTIRMIGAMLPLRHKPSWLTKRQIYLNL